MLYERYADKIKKIAAVRDKILKFKFLIIGVLVANFVLTVCFLATQGMMLGGIRGQTEYTYGNDVEFSATALFALRPSMEYSTDDGETWVKEAPVMPGQYKVRAVTHRLFVIPQRSEPVDFVINRKDLVLTLKEREIEWRTLPTVKASGLVRGDAISDVDVIVNNEEIGEAAADINENTVRVFSTDGSNVTFAYNITAEDGIINVTERPITLKANDVSKMYDGFTAMPDGYSFVDSSVLAGHTLSVSFSQLTQTTVGHESIKIADVKIFEGSKEVTNYYRVATRDGDANITKRPITVTPIDDEKIYDGKTFSKYSYLPIKDGDLVDGDEATVILGTPALSDVGSENIRVSSVTIKGIRGDVTHCYEITKETAQARITPRPIKITTKYFEKQYDGNTITLTSPTHYVVEGELVSNHGVVLALRTPSNYVNVCKDKPYDVEYYFTAGGVKNTNISKNYEVTLVNDECITITTSLIEITAKDITGLTYSATNIYANSFVNNQIICSAYLGRNYSVSVDFAAGAYKNAGTYNYTLNCRVLYGGVDVSQNFDIKIKYTGANSSKIVIDPYAVTISLNDLTKTYDGKAVTESECVKVSSLVGNEKLKISGFTNCVNVLIKNGSVSAYSFTITHAFDASSGAIASNYKVTYAQNKHDVSVTIRQHAVTISLNDLTKIYDGKAVAESECVKVSSLVGNEKLKINGFSNCVNVNRDTYGKVISYNLQIKYAFDSSSGAIADNYYVTYSNGKTSVNVLINPVAVQIIANDYTKMYDGKAADFKNVNALKLSLQSGVVTDSGKLEYALVGTDKLTVGFGGNAQYVDVVRSSGSTGYGSYQYTVSWKINSNNTGNYDVSVSYTNKSAQKSQVTIVPVRVEVSALDYEKIYDGTYVSVNDSKVTNIFVSAAYSNGAYTSYKEIFVDNASSKACYYLDSAKNDKISVFFSGQGKYKNVLRDGDGSVISYLYTINYDVEESKDTTVTDRIIDNYDVVVIYTRDSDGDMKTDCSRITIRPVIVNIAANNYSKIYDDVAVTAMTDGVLSDMIVDSLKINGAYAVVNRKHAVVNGKVQSYYELVSYTENGTKVVEKMVLALANADTGLVADKFVDVKRNDLGEVVAYRYYVVGEMLDGALMSNYELYISYDEYDSAKKEEYSKIIIVPRTVYVTTESGKFVFDGNAHSYPKGKIETGKDTDGDGVIDTGILGHHSKKEANGSWSDYLEMVNVGTKLNTVDFTVIETSSGINKSSNYEIVCKGGTLTIEPITVSFSAVSIKPEYSGKPCDVDVKPYSKVTLLDGDKILFVRAATDQIDVGEGVSYISLVVIKTRYGYEVYTFDGKTATVNTYQRKSSAEDMKIVVAYGEYIVIDVSDNVSYCTYDVKAQTHATTNADRYDDTAEESYSYYNFANKNGRIIVQPRRITVVCTSETASSGPLSGTARITVGNMVEGHYVYFVTSGTATTPGVPATNTVVDIQIYSSEDMSPGTLLDDSVKDNYYFEIIDGTLLIEDDGWGAMLKP